MHPADLGASFQFNKGDGTIILEFPLLNPGDRVDFSVLTKNSSIKFDAIGRIAGIPSLTIVKNYPQDRAGKSVPWTVYLVGVFSAFSLLVSIVGFTDSPKEMRIKARIKAGTFELPSLNTKEEWIAWVNSTFGFTTKQEREPLCILIRDLSDMDNSNTLYREKIMTGVQSLLRNATSNLLMALVFLVIAAAGGWYVISNL